MTIFTDLGFALWKGSFVSIVGASGCGKTTLLKIIAGLLRPTAGAVFLDGGRIEGPTRDMTLVFQEYNKSLLPWRNVEQNLRLGLVNRGFSQQEQERRIEDYLRLIDLVDARNRYPWQLSGGMQQRVAVARALACEPVILLLDEPYGSLDAVTRSRLEDELLSLWAERSMTVLLVTHDIDEALYLSDRVLILAGSPATITLDLPVNLPRPRDQIDSRASRMFTEMRTVVFKTLRGS